MACLYMWCLLAPEEVMTISEKHDKEAVRVAIPDGCTNIRASMQANEHGQMIVITGEKDGRTYEWAYLVE